MEDGEVLTTKNGRERRWREKKGSGFEVQVRRRKRDLPRITRMGGTRKEFSSQESEFRRQAEEERVQSGV